MSITKEDIFGMDDLPLTEVPVKEWGGRSVYVRALNGIERDQYEARLMMVQNDPTLESKLASVRGHLVFLCTCNEEGNRLFTEPEDFDALMGKHFQALDTIAEAAQKANALNDSDVEGIAKNLDPSGSDASTSD